tara:strand:- start:670 stop:1179 length:510 start_codon:yes stop_codon:yes gene_type:complete
MESNLSSFRNVQESLTEELTKLNINHELLDCDPELADTAQFCFTYGIELEDSANAILIVGKKEPRIFVLCLLLATHRLDVNGIVRKTLGTRKVSFASREETENVTGMIIGGVTPFALPESIPIWIDSAVMNRDSIIVGGGSRDKKIKIRPKELLKIENAVVIKDLAKKS